MHKIVFYNEKNWDEFIKEEKLDEVNVNLEFGKPTSFPICLSWYKELDKKNNILDVFGIYTHPYDFHAKKNEYKVKQKTNIYYLAFKYKQNVNVVKVTANQMANELLGHTDDIQDLKWNHEREKNEFGINDQGFTTHLWFDGNEYVIEFADDPHFFNIYQYVKDEEDPNEWYGENIVAKDVPWICIKIEDEDGNEIYNLENVI